MLRRRFAGPPQRAVVQLQEAAGGRLAGNVASQRRGAHGWDSQNEFSEHHGNPKPSFLGVITLILGVLKPSFFMVLGSEGTW